MDFLDPQLDAYVVANTEKEPEILAKLNRDTNLNVLSPRMLAGHFQGRTLSMISKMINPKHVLEIGTFTGYSAICLAEGLQAGGSLHTIDINEELQSMIERYLDEAGIADKVHLHIGNAMDIVPTIEGNFDLVYLDADKDNYANYYDMVFDRVNPGGYIIADNVLWSGKVLENYDSLDLDTKSLVDYSKKIQDDPRVENVLFPIRDGLMIARKK